MYNCAVLLDGCRVSYESTRDLASAFRHLSEQAVFTGLCVEEGASKSPFSIRYSESKEVSVQYYRQHAKINAPWSELREGEALLYAALPFIEVQYQRMGYVTSHAAAVAFPQGAVILLGPGGAGKTTTALTLCQRYGAKLIGNNLVVVGIDQQSRQIMIRGGTKFLHLRHESIRRNMPDLLYLFYPSGEDPWLNKIVMKAVDIGISVQEEPTPLFGAYLVHVDETQSLFFAKPADSVDTRLYLNENFSRYIRGTNVTLLKKDLSFLGFVPSFDSMALFKRRSILIEKLLKEPPMLYVSGNLNEVASFIASRTNRDGC